MLNNKYLQISLLVFLFISSIIYGQENKSIQITGLGQEQGLLQLNVQALTLDQYGFLWVGTEDGLHRFNGYEFKPYVSNPKDSTSIADDHIRGLLAVEDTLWIATNSKGIVGFEITKNRFFNLLDNKNDKNLEVAYKILKLSNNKLLFSTKNTIVIYDRNSKEKEIIALPSSNKENFVSDVIPVSKNSYWLATSATGILEFDIKTGNLSPIEEFKAKNVTKFTNTSEGILLGTSNGLFFYNKSDSKFYPTVITQLVKNIHPQKGNSFLVATNQGVFQYNSNANSFKKVDFLNKQQKIFNEIEIEQFQEDTNGNFWFGTAGEGVFHFNKFQKKFNTIKLELPNLKEEKKISVFPFHKSNDSTLWIGTRVGTLKYSFKTKKFKQYSTGAKGITYSFATDSLGNFWAGGIYDGLMKYNPTTDSFKQWLIGTGENSLPDNEVLDIIPMPNNKLWLGTWSGGISEFDTNKETFKPILINGKQIDRVRVHLKDSKGNLWLGTDEGLYEILKNKTVHHYTQDTKGNYQLTNNRVFAIKEDKSGAIWVGTSSGLTKIDNDLKKTTLYYMQKGFPNDFVYNILLDEKNNVWMSTNFGISVLNPKNETFKNYTKEDGLQDNEFNGKAALKDKNGIFYFGGINGFNIFDPAKVVDNPHHPKIYLESVELFNKPISRDIMFKDTLRFKSEENVLTFNYVALNYSNPQKVSYQFKLENFDEDWSPATSKRNITYTNLNPGKYVLNIRSSNDSGIWSKNIKKITLIIIPPWYKTTIFKIIFAVFLLLLGIGFYLYKIKKLKSDKEKLKDLVDKQTKDLLMNNEALKDSYAVTLNQKNNIEFLMKELNHRVKNNLQIISSLLNIQANTSEDESVRDILKIAKNRILTISYIQEQLSADSELVDVSEFMEDFTLKMVNTLSDENTIKFQVKFEVEPNIVCKMNITLLGLIINELVTNTFKYAFDSYKESNLLTFFLKKENNYLILKIQDNGKGYNLNEINKSSLGLDMVKEMTHQLNGQIQTTSNQGVENAITIPCES